GKDSCGRFLNAKVEAIWAAVRDDLAQLNRSKLTHRLIANNEALIADREHWSRTALAIIALYMKEDNVYAVASRRESDRSLSALCTRTLSEMAVCECPLSGGRDASARDVEKLLAKIAFMLEVARDSDAVHNDLVAPRVRVFSNGEYAVSHEFLPKV